MTDIVGELSLSNALAGIKPARMKRVQKMVAKRLRYGG
jgi:hypothetical protein